MLVINNIIDSLYNNLGTTRKLEADKLDERLRAGDCFKSNFLITLSCSHCGYKITRSLAYWKSLFKSNGIPYCSRACASFCNKLSIGFPEDSISKYRLILKYHSEEFKEILLNDLNKDSLTINEISNKYGFHWKFLRYHLCWYHELLTGIDFDERSSIVRSNKIKSNLIYNPFTDPSWQALNSSRATYRGRFGRNGFYYSQRFKKSYHYRSSYELEAYQLLDSFPEVLEYSIESVAIPYYSEGILHHYFPDIIVTSKSGKKFMIEIKAFDFINTEINRQKFIEARKYCKLNNIKFLVITELNWNLLCDLNQRLK